MSLSEEYKRQLKESLDMEEGGRLRALAQKAGAVNAPVLIVGLGGTGVDSLLVTKKLIYDTIRCDQTQDNSSDRPKNIEYLAIDTDEQYRNRSYRGMRLNENAGELMIYTMPNVSPILQNPEMQPPYIQNWLNTEINTTTVINGAGAVRQLGRLMLMENLGELQQVLNSKISRVVNGFPNNVPLYVFILAGISGGTGSGTFLDIPYMIKATAAQVTTGRVVQNIGILFMPDVNADKTGVDANKKQSIYANGYAALKELDYLMNIENVGDHFEQTYGTLKIDPADGKPYPPYNVCLLMSSKDRTGAKTGSGDENYQTITEIAAETVFNFVLGDDGVQALADFSIQSFLSNETNNANIYRTRLDDQRRPVNYTYSIAGASSAKLPIDDMISYLTYKAFKEIKTFWNQRPADADVEEVMKYFKLNRIEQTAKEKIRFADLNSLSFGTIRDSPGMGVQLCEAAKKKQEKQIAGNISKMLAALEQQIKDKNNIINQYFLDLSKGPVFAQQCLYSTNKQVKCVINELINIANVFVANSHDPDELDRLEQNASIALGQIRNGNVIFGRGSARDRYVEALDRQYKAHFENMLYEQLAQFCISAANMLTDENNRIYGIVAELMENLVPLFQKYGEIKTTATRKKGEGGGETLSWALVETPEFIKEVEKRIDTNPEFAVDMQKIISDFYHYLFDNTELWSGDRNNVVENINAFIYNEFRNILDHSMDFFLTMIADSKGQTLQAYCTSIINELRTKAEVHFPIDNVFANAAVPRPGYSFISVPGNSPQLYAAAKRIADASVTAGAQKSIVKQSGINDRIFMMNFESATPLSLYLDLKNFYNTYQTHRVEHGIHLFEPNQYSSVDWRDLPSPYPQTEWSGFQDVDEKKHNAVYKEVLEKALKYGYVTVDIPKRRMLCRWGQMADYEPALEAYGIKLSVGTPIPTNSAKRAVEMIKAQLEGEGQQVRLTESFTRDNMVTNENHTELKKDYMEMIFIQLFKVRDKIKEMVENHEECLRVADEIRARRIPESAIQGFALGRIRGLVTKDGFRYSYKDVDGVEQDLCTLSANQAKYPDHYLFNAYMQLEPEVRTDFEERANRPIKKEHIDKGRAKWQKYRAEMVDKKLDVLKKSWNKIDNGEKMLATYQLLKETVDALENIFGETNDPEDEGF